MKRHRLAKQVIAVVLCAAAASTILLWRLGLAPVYAGLISMNVVTLALYGYDKRQAVVGGTRIPEAALHRGGLARGQPRGVLAQGLFRHKTRKRGFRMVFTAMCCCRSR